MINGNVFCRGKIIKEKAVPMIEGYMFEEHAMIRVAATECMCNLTVSKEVSNHLHGYVGTTFLRPGCFIQWISLLCSIWTSQEHTQTPRTATTMVYICLAILQIHRKINHNIKTTYIILHRSLPCC